MQKELGAKQNTPSSTPFLCVNLDGYSSDMHQQVLSKNLKLFIAPSIHHLIPFPQITKIINFIQNCDEHSYFKEYLQRFLF